MSFILQACWELLTLEPALYRKDFAAIYERIRSSPVATQCSKRLDPTAICGAVDFAAALYFRKVLCLQRSAAAVRLLKKTGYDAKLVIGVQQVPLAAHAWVELEGTVLNDKSYMPEIYSVLDRC